MEYLSNRLVGESKFPPDAFFFVYDYWSYDEGSDALRSVTTGEIMPEPLMYRLKDQ